MILIRPTALIMHIRTFATTFAVAAISLGANAEIRDAVVDKDAPVSQPTADATESFTAADGKYHFTLDTSETPDLTEWARQKLVPMATEWYPKLVATLPSEGFEAPTNIS